MENINFKNPVEKLNLEIRELKNRSRKMLEEFGSSGNPEKELSDIATLLKEIADKQSKIKELELVKSSN